MVEDTQPASCIVAPNSTEQSFLLFIELYRSFINVASVDTLTVSPEAGRFSITLSHLTGSAVNRYQHSNKSVRRDYWLQNTWTFMPQIILWDGITQLSGKGGQRKANVCTSNSALSVYYSSLRTEIWIYGLAKRLCCKPFVVFFFHKATTIIVGKIIMQNRLRYR